MTSAKQSVSRCVGIAGGCEADSLCDLRGSLWLSGVNDPKQLNHRDTQNSEEAQKAKLGTHPLPRGGTDSIAQTKLFQ